MTDTQKCRHGRTNCWDSVCQQLMQRRTARAAHIEAVTIDTAGNMSAPQSRARVVHVQAFPDA